MGQPKETRLVGRVEAVSRERFGMMARPASSPPWASSQWGAKACAPPSGVCGGSRKSSPAPSRGRHDSPRPSRPQRCSMDHDPDRHSSAPPAAGGDV